MEQHERLQALERGGLVEEQVVAAKDGAGARVGEDLRVRLGDQPDPRLPVPLEDLRVGDGAAEGDHPHPPLGRSVKSRVFITLGTLP